MGPFSIAPLVYFPETNSKFGPENGWLLISFFWGKTTYFSGALSYYVMLVSGSVKPLDYHLVVGCINPIEFGENKLLEGVLI